MTRNLLAVPRPTKGTIDDRAAPPRFSASIPIPPQPAQEAGRHAVVPRTVGAAPLAYELRAALRASVRRHRRAQGVRSTLRSITLRQAGLGEEDEMSLTLRNLSS